MNLFSSKAYMNISTLLTTARTYEYQKYIWTHSFTVLKTPRPYNIDTTKTFPWSIYAHQRYMCIYLFTLLKTPQQWNIGTVKHISQQYTFLYLPQKHIFICLPCRTRNVNIYIYTFDIHTSVWGMGFAVPIYSLRPEYPKYVRIYIFTLLKTPRPWNIGTAKPMYFWSRSCIDLIAGICVV